MEIPRAARLLTVALACVSASAIALPAATAAPTPNPSPTAGPGAFSAAPYTADPTPAVRGRVVDAAQKALASHAGAAHKADGDAFSVRNLVVDRDGSAAVRFDRTYKGLPTYGGDVIVHLKNDGTYQSLATGSATSGGGLHRAPTGRRRSREGVEGRLHGAHRLGLRLAPRGADGGHRRHPGLGDRRRRHPPRRDPQPSARPGGRPYRQGRADQ
ncbi:hypothetical protein [Streptomyces xanthochromogenes]|uniref:hypothetical protein n=1 Tax=Streptomyces xanthochromogenes TaxID=67384 RepID=UPI002F426047